MEFTIGGSVTSSCDSASIVFTCWHASVGDPDSEMSESTGSFAGSVMGTGSTSSGGDPG